MRLCQAITLGLAVGILGVSASITRADEPTAPSPTAVPDIAPAKTPDTNAVASAGCNSAGCNSAGCRSAGCSSYVGNTWDRIAGESYLDSLKNVSIGNCWTTSIGGEIRHRHMSEKNRLRPGGPGTSTYDLWRISPYLEVKRGDQITAFVQAIDSSIFNQELPITSIDQNRSDLLQYYLDAQIAELDGGNLRVRVGRQMLKYGSEHLVSTLGWSNTFRNFEGIRFYYQGTDWDIDGFWTRPVNGASGNVFRPTSADHPDASRQFSGVYTTYKGLDSGILDLYWLFLDENSDKANRLDGQRHTFGARYATNKVVKEDCHGDALGTLSFELEGAFQVGDHETLLTAVNEDIWAGMIHTAIGYTFEQAAWKPNIKAVFYYSSGDDNPGDGENGNFNTLFPLGHAYWGIIDNVNGSNLIDYSLQGSVKPCDKLSLASAVHWFEKTEAAAPIFNVGGAPFSGGNRDTDIGVELDLVATYAVNKDLKVQLGYQWFWYGDAVDNAAAPIPRGDARQLYLMTTWGF